MEPQTRLSAFGTLPLECPSDSRWALSDNLKVRQLGLEAEWSLLPEWMALISGKLLQASPLVHAFIATIPVRV